MGEAGTPTKEGSNADMDVLSGVENRMEKYDPPRSVTAPKVNEDVSNVNEATMRALREENKQLSDRLSVLEKQLYPTPAHQTPAQLQRKQPEAVLASSWSTPGLKVDDCESAPTTPTTSLPLPNFHALLHQATASLHRNEK